MDPFLFNFNPFYSHFVGSTPGGGLFWIYVLISNHVGAGLKTIPFTCKACTQPIELSLHNSIKYLTENILHISIWL